MLDRSGPLATKDFAELPRNYFRAILVDPPWRFRSWDAATTVKNRSARTVHYRTLQPHDITSVPLRDLADDDCALFLWVIWPLMPRAIEQIREWGFEYKTCAFAWMKTNPRSGTPVTAMGYWTRANTEVCLLATRGKPKRRDKGVRQAILEPRREHSRKPDCVYERIERLVPGPYVELFARTQRKGWFAWGNEVHKFIEGGSTHETTKPRHLTQAPGGAGIGDRPNGDPSLSNGPANYVPRWRRIHAGQGDR
jgi:N6-adenosine-specific RNA methylase IME4